MCFWRRTRFFALEIDTLEKYSGERRSLPQKKKEKRNPQINIICEFEHAQNRNSAAIKTADLEFGNGPEVHHVMP